MAALNDGMGSSSLKAEVKALFKLHFVHRTKCRERNGHKLTYVNL